MIHGANTEWLRTLEIVKTKGLVCSPRNLPVREVRHHTTKFQMKSPVVHEKSRKLSYKFMAAEAMWIMDGSNRLNYHPEIEKKLRPYSDDGVHLSGAYGPRISDQYTWVYSKLKEDRDSRQAVIDIWQPCPRKSKDIPCTCTMQFMIREDVMHLSVFMRSSDVWMGLPYDMFSFTVVAQTLASLLNADLGVCCITAGSSHLYEHNVSDAEAVLYRPRIIPEVVQELTTGIDLSMFLAPVAGSETNSGALDMLLTWDNWVNT